MSGGALACTGARRPGCLPTTPRWRIQPTRASLGWPFFLAAGGALLLIASLIRGWLDFLDGGKHPEPSAGVLVLWVFVALIGFAAVSIAYVRDKDGALRASEISGYSERAESIQG